MRYRLSLTIRYLFDRPAGGGRQHLRITPASVPGVQSVDQVRLTCQPAALEQGRFTDFFGSEVTEVLLPPGLSDLAITLQARVTRHDMPANFDLSAALSDLPAQIAADHGMGPDAPHHYLGPSPRIPHLPEIETYARAHCAATPSARHLVEALGRALHRDIAFDATATDVDTPVAQAFDQRRGVCQDMAQIMICGLRALGVPAGYVSGFLRTLPPPGKARLQGADAMHAWVRAWTGTEGGWVEYDPTNACFVGRDHILVGHGRDYGDAAPVIGMLRLAGGQAGHHACDIEPE